jgi:hypothetical protein
MNSGQKSRSTNLLTGVSGPAHRTADVPTSNDSEELQNASPSETLSKITEAAQQAGTQAANAVTSLASDATQSVRGPITVWSRSRISISMRPLASATGPRLPE